VVVVVVVVVAGGRVGGLVVNSVVGLVGRDVDDVDGLVGSGVVDTVVGLSVGWVVDTVVDESGSSQEPVVKIYYYYYCYLRINVLVITRLRKNSRKIDKMKNFKI